MEKVASKSPGIESNLLESEKVGNLKKQYQADDHQAGKCGLGPCQPRWIQSLADVRAFVFNITYIRLVSGLTFSILIASLTTIEKRFHLRSQQTGMWISAFEFTNIPTSLLAGYFLSAKHTPRVLGISTLLCVLVFFIGALPHFFFGEKTYLETFNSSVETSTQDICNLEHDNNDAICFEGETDHTNSISYGLLLLLSTTYGIVGTPIGILVLPFLDDICDPKKSAHYGGIVISMYGIGPLLGFMIGAALLTIPINLEKTSLTPGDPQWMGAYWLSFVVGSLLFLIATPTMLMFPKGLKGGRDKKNNKRTDSKNKDDVKDDVGVNLSTFSLRGKTSFPAIKGLPKALYRLLTNPIFICLNLGNVFEFYNISGILSFMPKYIEEQFGQPSSIANVVAGIIACSSSASGIYLGGILAGKWKLGIVGGSRAVLFSSIASLSLLIAITFIGCDTGKASSFINEGLNASCYADCACGSDLFNPICGADNVTYLSPCHAGCLSSVIENGTEIYKDCLCITSLDNDAVSGVCSDAIKPCFTNMVIYGILLFCTSFSSGLGAMPQLSVLFRATEPRDKSTAFALTSVVGSLLAWIPAPILFGTLVDSACLLWQTSPCEPESRVCRAYDPDAFRFYLHGFCILFRALKVIIIGLLCFFASRHEKKTLKREMEQNGASGRELLELEKKLEQ